MIKLLNYPKAEFSFMEVIIYLFRRFFADTADFFNIFDTGLRNFLHRTEIIQQISFPLGADSFHLVQTRFGNRLGPFLPMRSDSKTVRLDKRIMVGYARVSSYDQRSDLAAQTERLSHYGCQLVIKDLGSGLNCKKPGLKRLLRLLLLHRIGTLVLTHDDRLLRFGTELIYYIAHYMGTRVVILDEPEQQSFETELVKDVITLMTVFCARLYGKRSWKNKVKENTGIKSLSFS